MLKKGCGTPVIQDYHIVFRNIWLMVRRSVKGHSLERS